MLYLNIVLIPQKGLDVSNDLIIDCFEIASVLLRRHIRKEILNLLEVNPYITKSRCNQPYFFFFIESFLVCHINRGYILSQVSLISIETCKSSSWRILLLLLHILIVLFGLVSSLALLFKRLMIFIANAFHKRKHNFIDVILRKSFFEER